MKQSMLSALGILALVSQLLAPAAAQTPALTSTFDTGDEGWTIVGFDPYAHNLPQAGSPVTYAATFGNPSGSIEAGDVYWGTAISAPASFLGDRRNFFGGSINFDMYLRYVTAGSANSTVTLLGASHTLFYVDVPNQQTNTWVAHSYTLNPAGWLVDSITGSFATPAMMLEVLADLRGLWITTEWNVGPDDTNVDNIVLSPPAHGSVALFGDGTNPETSLSRLSGNATLGKTLTLGIDNPFGTQAPGSLPFLAISTTPMAPFPAGTILPGMGMASSSSPGQLLIDFTPAALAAPVLMGAPWTGPGNPVPFALTFPSDPALAGVNLYAQGVLADLAPGGWLALTYAAMLTLGL